MVKEHAIAQILEFIEQSVKMATGSGRDVEDIKEHLRYRIENTIFELNPTEINAIIEKYFKENPYRPII